MRTRSLALGTVLFGISVLGAAATYTVSTTADSGLGSLRKAILDANLGPGPHTIAFDISGGGVHTIAPLTELPAIVQAVTIDGYTQTGSSPNTNPLAAGSNAVILIELDGEHLATGSPLQTAGTGLSLSAGGCAVRGLAINRFGRGISIGGANSVVAGNVVGLDPTGKFVPGSLSQHTGIIYVYAAAGHALGGPNPADRNVISGNHDLTGFSGGGVVFIGGVQAVDVKIRGNYIGTDAKGTHPVPNAIALNFQSDSGGTVGGASPGEGNVISGNSGNAISAVGGVTVLGNFIGTDASSTLDLGNSSSAVSVGASTIGGIGPGQGNVIAHNKGPGVIVGGKGTRIRGNRIFGNKRLGIQLDSGLPPNDLGDADTGSNNLQNYPMITSVDYGASTTTVHADFNSKPSTKFDVDFYANPACPPPPTSHLQGQDYIGSIQVTTDSSGNAAIDAVLPLALQPGQPVTAVATDPGGNSSEFSEGILLQTDVRSGPASGGTTVQLLGQQFDDGTTVSVGGVPAANVVHVGPTHITADMPVRPAGSINDITVTNTAGRSGTLRSAWIANFADVGESYPFYDSIIKLVANGVTRGCSAGGYCPEVAITRAQIAIFLIRARYGLCYVPPAATGTKFTDVPASGFGAAFIEEIAAEGITSGCGGGKFCPDLIVTRDQMAVLLLKSRFGSTYSPSPAAGIFSDVPATSPYARWIEDLAHRGITAGCGTGTYCPNNASTRGEMAVFVGRTFGLQ